MAAGGSFPSRLPPGSCRDAARSGGPGEKTSATPHSVGRSGGRAAPAGAGPHGRARGSPPRPDPASPGSAPQRTPQATAGRSGAGLLRTRGRRRGGARVGGAAERGREKRAAREPRWWAWPRWAWPVGAWPDRHAQPRPLGRRLSPGGGNRSRSALPGWPGRLRLASPPTMGDPSKQDILSIFRRLRSVPTNKVAAAGRGEARWAPVSQPAGGPAAVVAAAAGGGARGACDTSHLRPRRLGLAWVRAAPPPAAASLGEERGGRAPGPRARRAPGGSWGRDAAASGGPWGRGHALVVPDTGRGGAHGAAPGGAEWAPGFLRQLGARSGAPPPRERWGGAPGGPCERGGPAGHL